MDQLGNRCGRILRYFGCMLDPHLKQGKPATFASGDRLLALAVFCLALATRLPFLDADEGWYDEIFSIYTAAQPTAHIVRIALSEQTNPPGYYLLTSFWGALGGTAIPWHRLLVVLCGSLAPAIVVLAARRLGFSRWAAGVAGVLTVAAPYLWRMSLEIRSYAPLAVLTSVALWLAAELATADVVPRGYRLWALAGVHAAMVMLHYFAAFSVLGISLAVACAARTRLRTRWAETLRLTGVLGIPAATVVIAWGAAALSLPGGMDGRNVAWIPDVSPITALQQIPGLALANVGPMSRRLSDALLLLGIIVVLQSTTIGRLRLRDRRDTSRFLLLAALLPVLCVWGLQSSGVRNLWVARYLTGFLPGLALVAAIVVDTIPQPARRTLALSIGGWWLVAGWFSFAARTPKPDWTQMLSALAPNGRATLCTHGSFVGLPFLYHARAQGLDGVRVVSTANCVPGPDPTWLVYDVERTGVTPPPDVAGVAVGPRIAMFRGLQSLDARRVTGPAPHR